MNYIKKIILSIVACAVTLQAQANVSEYATHVKEFVWNHKGKIAIGLVTLAVTSGLYGLLCRYIKAKQRKQNSVSVSEQKESQLAAKISGNGSDNNNNASTLELISHEYQEELDRNTLSVFQRVNDAVKKLQMFTSEEEVKLLMQIKNQVLAIEGLEKEFLIAQVADIMQACLKHRSQISDDKRKQVYAYFKQAYNYLINNEDKFVFEGNLKTELNDLKIACDFAFDDYKGDDFDATISATYEKIETVASNIVQILTQN